MSMEPSTADVVAAREIPKVAIDSIIGGEGKSYDVQIASRVIADHMAPEREAADALADAAERHERMQTTRSRAVFRDALDAYRKARAGEGEG